MVRVRVRVRLVSSACLHDHEEVFCLRRAERRAEQAAGGADLVRVRVRARVRVRVRVRVRMRVRVRCSCCCRGAPASRAHRWPHAWRAAG